MSQGTEIAVLKKRFLLKPAHVEELDSWHSNWLLDCPKGETRYVVVLWVDGSVVDRQCFLDKKTALEIQRLNPSLAVLITFGRS